MMDTMKALADADWPYLYEGREVSWAPGPKVNGIYLRLAKIYQDLASFRNSLGGQPMDVDESGPVGGPGTSSVPRTRNPRPSQTPDPSPEKKKREGKQLPPPEIRFHGRSYGELQAQSLEQSNHIEEGLRKILKETQEAAKLKEANMQAVLWITMSSR